ERASQTGGRGSGMAPVSLSDLAIEYVGRDSDGRLADLDLRKRVTENIMAARAHELTLVRAAAEAKSNSGPGFTPSILKNSATNVAQTRAELMLEIMGTQGLGWEGSNFSRSEIEATRMWLSGKAMSTYGGSAEIQNNIISKRILRLPDTTHST